MKKKVNIILLLVVLSLWGTVAWKSLKNFFHQPNEAENKALYQSININKIEKDTFTLEKLNRDPFLQRSLAISKSYTKLTNSNKYRVSSKKGNLSNFYKPVVDKPQPIELPNFRYVGYIKSTQQKEEMVLIKIDENLKRFVVGKKYDAILVKKVFKDSLQIVYNKKVFMVKK